MLKKRLFFLFFFFIHYFLSASLYQNKIHGFYVDFPESWEVNKILGSKALVSFSNTDKNAVFSIVIEKPIDGGINEYFSNFIKENNATGDKANFIYYGNDAVFSSLDFSINGLSFKGYFIAINTGKKIYLLSAYSLTALYELNHDFLLSCIDSFSLDKEKLVLPGPVSVFYYTKEKSDDKNRTIVFEGKNIDCELDEKEIDASEVAIEREARVLLSYSSAEDRNTPWNRYYNMLFRDNYHRIKPVFDKIVKESNLTSGSNEDKVKRIARWIQNYEYERTGTLSDITSPIKAILFSIGDCDSRTLLFLLIMDYLGIDAVMLVSTYYNHSAVGVLLEKTDGAKITFNKKQYLFIELTEEIEIGLVQKKMTDATKWVPMKLGY